MQLMDRTIRLDLHSSYAMLTTSSVEDLENYARLRQLVLFSFLPFHVASPERAGSLSTMMPE